MRKRLRSVAQLVEVQRVNNARVVVAHQVSMHRHTAALCRRRLLFKRVDVVEAEERRREVRAEHGAVGAAHEVNARRFGGLSHKVYDVAAAKRAGQPHAGRGGGKGILGQH